MEKPDSDIIRKLIEKFEFREKFERIYIKYKDKKEPVDFIAIFFAIIAGMVSLIAFFGIAVGLIASILIICIGLYIFRYLRIRSKASEDAKRHISNDLEKNVGNKRTRKFPIGKVIKIFIILLVFSLLYVNFHTYFVDPEITITSPRAGDVVKIDKDNTFHKISGNSKGLANNQFLHLFILYRRVDSNQEPGVWNCDYNLLRDHCTVYNDGRWECPIQLNELYEECVNETLFVKSPTNSSNNISINVDIVVIITKQSIMRSVFTKLKTRYLQVLNEVDGPDWYKLIIFLLPTGKGTFYDRSYDLFPDWRYGLYYHLPKHLADDHVTITPLIMDHLSDTCGYDESDRATIELNQSFQEENLKIETLIEITGEEKAEKAFGGYIKDSSIRRFIFNGRKIKFVEKPDRNWRVQSGEYKIIMTRKVKTVNDGDSVVTFEVSVISENDEFFSKKTYRIFSEKNLTVGFDFYSKDKESSMAMDYIKIFTF